MITLELHSPHPPSVVLDSLDKRGGEWRQSQFPAELRSKGVTAVECHIRDATCTLTLRHRWYRPGEPHMHLSAELTVLPGSDGSRVLVDLSYRNPVNPWLAALAVVLITGSGLALFGMLGFSFSLIAGCALLAIQTSTVRGYNRDLTRVRTAETDYLLARVKSAVASAGEPTAARMVQDGEGMTG